MPSKYPVLTPDEIEKGLKQFGFWKASQKGSHVKYTNGERTTIVPWHREIAKGTLRSILEKADIGLDDFMKKIK